MKTEKLFQILLLAGKMCYIFWETAYTINSIIKPNASKIELVISHRTKDFTNFFRVSFRLQYIQTSLFPQLLLTPQINVLMIKFTSAF